MSREIVCVCVSVCRGIGSGVNGSDSAPSAVEVSFPHPYVGFFFF